MIRVGIVGAMGYGGVELIRVLNNHPQVTIHRLYSSSTEGEAPTSLFPHLDNGKGSLPDLEAIDAEKMAHDNDVIFLATPAGISATLSPALLEANGKVIDLSGDFRLQSAQSYRSWYKKEPAESKFLETAVYGLTEWRRDAVADATLVSNPGCYPTASLLGLLPLAKSGWVDPKSWILDAKSGVSGAGRGVSLGVHFSEVNENVAAYKVAQHQHTPEIEQELSKQSGAETVIQFTPHLIPMTRGILVTAYGQLTKDVPLQQLQELYEEQYGHEPFVRIRKPGSYPKTKEVYGSNFCDISLHLDSRTGRVIVLSVIDNMVKGAAGQAVQNMNVMFGLQETMGLSLLPLFP